VTRAAVYGSPAWRRWKHDHHWADFAPLSLPGIVFLGRADASVRNGANNTSQLTNLAGTTNAVQGTTANQPLYVAAALNGRDVLRFNGSSDFLTLDGLVPLFAGADQPLTYVAVLKLNALSVMHVPLGLANTSNNAPNTYCQIAAADNKFYWNRRDDAVATGDLGPSSVLATASAMVLSVVFTGTSLTIYRNGTSILAGASNVGSATFTSLTLGALRSVSAIGFLNADLAELHLCAGALATADRQRDERYLGQRYGIVVA